MICLQFEEWIYPSMLLDYKDDNDILQALI